MRLDHVVLKVDDLAQACETFTRFGFRVISGGVHKAFGSHNALIAFADGSYLELIAFLEPQPSQNRCEAIAALQQAHHSPAECRRLTWKVVTEGLLDFALIPQADKEDFAQAEHLDYESPFSMSRTRPDGVELQWEIKYPNPFDLPFLIRDITERNWRVPQEHAHPLGVTGVAKLMVAVQDLPASTLRYEKLLRTRPEPLGKKERIPETQGVSFSCGSTDLVLLAPTETNEALHTHLAQREESICRLELRYRGKTADASVLEPLAHMKIFLQHEKD